MEALPRPRIRLALEIVGYALITFSLLVLGLGIWQRSRGGHFIGPGPLPMAAFIGVLFVRRARSLAPRRNELLALAAGLLFLGTMVVAVLTSNPHFR